MCRFRTRRGTGYPPSMIRKLPGKAWNTWLTTTVSSMVCLLWLLTSLYCILIGPQTHVWIRKDWCCQKRSLLSSTRLTFSSFGYVHAQRSDPASVAYISWALTDISKDISCSVCSPCRLRLLIIQQAPATHHVSGHWSKHRWPKHPRFAPCKLLREH